MYGALVGVELGLRAQGVLYVLPAFLMGSCPRLAGSAPSLLFGIWYMMDIFCRFYVGAMEYAFESGTPVQRVVGCMRGEES